MIYQFDDFSKIIKSDFVCNVDGLKIKSEDIDFNLYKNYVVCAISIEKEKILIELKRFKTPKADVDFEFDSAQDEKKKNCTKLSFF